MQYNFVLIRTDKGRKYARKILNSVTWINQNKYPQHTFLVSDFTIDKFLDFMSEENYDDFVEEFPYFNTIIHARCANPRTEWTIKLRELEEMGYKVVNSVDTIELTSNKLACSLHLQGKVNHPKSWEWNKNWTIDQKIDFIESDIIELTMDDRYIIAKPYTSLEQGANVKKVELGLTPKEIADEFDSVPGNKIVIQEYIPYIALHRVIVIGGKALPYTFIDRVEYHNPGDWKVSCCLNRTTMRLNEPQFYAGHSQLLDLAEKTQKEVGGVINFIDIFEYKDDNGNIAYTNAEINTACSLNIHEKLAKQAGRTDWNIHYRIAKQLVKELGV